MKRLEGLSEFACDDQFFLFHIDFDADEERLIEQAAYPVGSDAVHLEAVGGDVDRHRERALHGLELNVDPCQAVVDANEFGGEPILFLSHEIDGNRASQVGVDEFAASIFETVSLQREVVAKRLDVFVRCFHFGKESFLQRLRDADRNDDRAIQVDDFVFDVVDEDGTHVAVVGFAVSPDTHQVRVDPAVALRVVHDHAALAAGAVGGASEVVREEAILLTVVVGRQDLLDAGPGRRRDERFVTSLVDDAIRTDDAAVVRVGEHFVEQLRVDGSARASGRWLSRESAVREFGGEQGDCGLSGGVSLEGVGDHRRTHRVLLDCSDLAVQFVEVTDVSVAERRAADGAAGLDLLPHALLDLGRKVLRIELRDRTHDAVHEHPGRRLIDALGGRDEFGSRGLQRDVDRDVVGAVASQAVDLVDDDVRDRVVTNELEHLLECRSIGRTSGLAGVDELAHDVGTETFGGSDVRVTLRGDRVALDGSVALRLVARADPHVDHRLQAFGGCGCSRHQISSRPGIWGRPKAS